MPFESLIVTGTSCSGKSTIVELLQKESNSSDVRFELVEAVTTREKREDDTNYKYITDEEFNVLLREDSLLVHDSYRNKNYGVTRAAYKRVVDNHVIPIIVVTPKSAAELLSEYQNKYMCIFVDAPDDVLINRFKKRNGRILTKEESELFSQQRSKDREFANVAHYTIENSEIDSSISLIRLLWQHADNGGGLPHDYIVNMLKCGVLLQNIDLNMVHGASYDLRLGDEYYYGGEIRKLSSKKPFLTIEPYDYAIVSCVETACIPRDIVGKFGLSVSLFCQGIILSNGPQIDPGFKGTLFCLLFNTSNRAVHLKRGKHYATIEFNKLIGYAKPYEGKYQNKDSIIEYIPANALHGAINELKLEVERLKNESRIMQNIYLGVVALMFAVISILLIIK